MSDYSGAERVKPKGAARYDLCLLCESRFRRSHPEARFCGVCEPRFAEVDWGAIPNWHHQLALGEDGLVDVDLEAERLERAETDRLAGLERRGMGGY